MKARRQFSRLMVWVVGLLTLTACTHAVARQPTRFGLPRPRRAMVSPGRAATAQLSRVGLDGGRVYLFHLAPGSAAVARPLVIALSGFARSADWMARVSGLERTADRFGFDVAFPQQLHGHWNAGSCCGTAKPDDVGFVGGVLASFEGAHLVDRSRVYLIGFSNGGMLAYRAACEQPSEFAAVGTVAGSLLPDVTCNHSIVHVIHIYGTQDRTVPPNGGRGFEGTLFLPVSSEASRVGQGSTVDVRAWNGGHVYPTWATTEIWSWLKVWRAHASH
jgi:poly(3-hydroxybutyrate) depolymerase